MQLLSAVAIVILTALEHSRTTRPSTIITIYLIAAIAADAVQIRTLLGRAYAPTIVRLVAASVSTKSILLVLESWPKTSCLLPADEPLGPEDVSGPLTRNTFWWLSPLLLLGNCSLLSVEDLPLLDQALLSKLLRKRMARSWTRSMYAPPVQTERC